MEFLFSGLQEALVMPRLFVGNFSFEHELASPSGWRPSAALQRISTERAVAWIALADDGDAIWTPEPIPDSFWESLAIQGLSRVRGVVELDTAITSTHAIVPWGWSSSTRALAHHRELPSDAAVRQGNSREWSFGLEQELRVALPGAARLECLADFAAIVERSAAAFGLPVAEQAWVIKANFGMAARERLLGRGSQLDEAQQRWLSRHLAADGAVYFEPWLHRLSEVGIQWTLPPLGQGPPTLEGIAPLCCDAQGGYRGSEFSLDAAISGEWQRAVEVCEQVAARLQSLGYFGPLGIDAATYQDAAGAVHVRPLQDINARHTMGRLALGFRKLLRPHETGLWQHGRCSELLNKAAPATWRELFLTPPLIGHCVPTFGSRLLIRNANDASLLAVPQDTHSGMIPGH